MPPKGGEMLRFPLNDFVTFILVSTECSAADTESIFLHPVERFIIAFRVT
jgi:hypothetical protein